MCRWWFHWRLAEMLHNDDCGQYTWRSSRVRGRWLSTRFSKHVARDTQSRTFDKGLIKRCVSHMTSNSRTNKFLSYNLKCLILVQLIKSLNKLITQQIPRNSAVIRNQYRKRYDVIPLDSSCRAFRSNEQQITFENTYQLCSRQTLHNSQTFTSIHQRIVTQRKTTDLLTTDFSVVWCWPVFSKGDSPVKSIWSVCVNIEISCKRFWTLIIGRLVNLLGCQNRPIMVKR